MSSEYELSPQAQAALQGSMTAEYPWTLSDWTQPPDLSTAQDDELDGFARDDELDVSIDLERIIKSGRPTPSVISSEGGFPTRNTETGRLENEVETKRPSFWGFRSGESTNTPRTRTPTAVTTQDNTTMPSVRRSGQGTEKRSSQVSRPTATPKSSNETPTFTSTRTRSGMTSRRESALNPASNPDNSQMQRKRKRSDSSPDAATPTVEEDHTAGQEDTRNDPTLVWDYTQRVVLHFLFVHTVTTNQEKEDIFNNVFQAELASLGFKSTFPYANMRKQEAEKRRKYRPVPPEWVTIVAEDRADRAGRNGAVGSAARARRDEIKARVVQAARDLNITLDN
ncbi:uncharacterized protein RCC_09921 [Ramularia collo-cygni]|uniref:Uncharacterized protein n=1 Tax=Ramularia collo-cygni TaxID=112498 RepID=A0A2D3VMY9_9PEZI|nr:uncharacterized protein RCC_09921 [Ramularia collo-cygni]CZT24204.1 uncharacterized protein RCC_09921 [Ramularia collo-cygni]